LAPFNAPPLISARLETFRQQRRLQAGSLIITAFGDAILPRGGRIWLGSLIRLLQPLGLNERLVRTSVFRLVKEEWLSTETVGRRAEYALTPSGRRRFEEASRHIYASHAPQWDRRWRLILVVSELDSTVRDQLRSALFWQGFGVLGADCFVHPGADLPRVLDSLVAEGLAATLTALLPLLAAEARVAGSACDADLVVRAWNLEGLAQAYTAFASRYGPLLDELRNPDVSQTLGGQEAFLLRLVLIHDYRRLLLRDPELPEVLLPPHWPGEHARLLCRELYTRLNAPSNRHLDEVLCLADGRTLIEEAGSGERFALADPLEPENQSGRWPASGPSWAPTHDLMIRPA
jgi:phenylacetic acid degradation operon negative regulatory protein